MPVDLSGLDPTFCVMSLAMLFVYFLVGMSVFSHVPMSFLSSAATDETCVHVPMSNHTGSNHTGHWVTVGPMNLCPSREMTIVAHSVCGACFYRR